MSGGWRLGGETIRRGTLGTALSFLVVQNLTVSVTWAGNGVWVANARVEGFPHLIDIAAPSSAAGIDGQSQPAAALVFLHGGGGTKEGVEVELGVTAEWAQTHRTVVAVPQGQSLQTCSHPPCSAYTWSNDVMSSGQDDVAFLRKLSELLRKDFSATNVTLVGHSNGAMMTNRMWCEPQSADAFDAFVAFDGPASSWFDHDAASPADYKPCDSNSALFMDVIAYEDNVIGNTPANHIDEATWSISRNAYILASYAYVNRFLVNPWFFYERVRGPASCGQSPDRARKVASFPRTNFWSACDGHVGLTAIKGADDVCSRLARGHCLAFLKRNLGCDLLEFSLQWSLGCYQRVHSLHRLLMVVHPVLRIQNLCR
eukprot:SAG31_NODE_7133_length_1780_cov_2.048780_1_plen_371_part_00